MATLALPDAVGLILAALLTLCVFSLLFRDNALYRLAEYLFVAVAVGYVTVIAFDQVLMAKVVRPVVNAIRAPAGPDVLSLVLLLIPAALGLLLLLKSTRRAGPLSWLGSLTVATLLGVGAAVAIAGAMSGTLLPQVAAAAEVMHYTRAYPRGLAIFSGVMAVVGTAGVLLHFHFGRSREGRLSGPRAALVQVWGGLGWWFVLVAFGALLSTTFLARVSQLGGRIQFLLDAVRQLVGG
jgi:hypothetical protein